MTAVYEWLAGKAVLLVIVAGLLAAVGAQWLRIDNLKTEHSTYVAQVAREETDRAMAALEATKETQRIAARWNAQQLGALNAAHARETVLSADAGSARDELGRLRLAVTKAASRRSVPVTTTDADAHDPSTEAVVFLECAAAYEELARTAGGHASDVETLEDGWPK